MGDVLGPRDAADLLLDLIDKIEEDVGLSTQHANLDGRLDRGAEFNSPQGRFQVGEPLEGEVLDPCDVIVDGLVGSRVDQREGVVRAGRLGRVGEHEPRCTLADEGDPVRDPLGPLSADH